MEWGLCLQLKSTQGSALGERRPPFSRESWARSQLPPGNVTLTLKQTDSCRHKCGCYFLTINQGLVRESRLSCTCSPQRRKAEGGAQEGHADPLQLRPRLREACTGQREARGLRAEGAGGGDRGRWLART